MDLEIKKWGNSAAVRIPSTLLEQLKANLGDKLTVDLTGEGMLLKPKRKKYTLDELLAQCDLSAEVPEEIKEWDRMPAVGNEVW